MAWSKRDLVAQAFEAIGLAAYVFDLTPDQMQSAVRKMDAMVASWNVNGIRIAYPLPSSPDMSDLDDPVPCPDYAIEPLYLGLGIRIAPTVGKVVSPETKMMFDAAYKIMEGVFAVPAIERQLPGTMPRGAGTKPWRNYDNPFIRPAEEPLLAGDDNPITFE